MATTTIAVRDDGYPLYDFEQEIGGRVYQFVMRWNEREEAWYFDLLTDAGDVIEHGIKVVIDWPLLRRNRAEYRPSGEILALDTTGSGVACGRLDLGQRVQLVYQT